MNNASNTSFPDPVTGAMSVGGEMVVGAGVNDMAGTGWTVNGSGRVRDGYGDGVGRGSGIL